MRQILHGFLGISEDIEVIRNTVKLILDRATDRSTAKNYIYKTKYLPISLPYSRLTKY